MEQPSGFKSSVATGGGILLLLPPSDPVRWLGRHQGGPGSDSIAVGLYTEMGYFQVDSNGTYVNEHAWNNVRFIM